MLVLGHCKAEAPGPLASDSPGKQAVPQPGENQPEPALLQAKPGASPGSAHNQAPAAPPHCFPAKAQLSILVPKEDRLPELRSVAWAVPPPWLQAQGKKCSERELVLGKRIKCPLQGNAGMVTFSARWGGRLFWLERACWGSGDVLVRQRQDKAQAVVLLVWLRNRRNLPRLMLGSKRTTGCQHRPPSHSPASSGAGPAAGRGLGEATACPCKPWSGHTLQQPSSSLGMTCQTCLFSHFVTWSYPLIQQPWHSKARQGFQLCPWQ